EERARAATFTHAGRRREFTLGRAAARLLLAEHLGVEPGRVPLFVADDGAPAIEGEDVGVSIAHTGDHAVAAVAARRVGVDLERIAPRHPGLPQFLLHPEEYEPFDALPLDGTRGLILYWTLKEATLKALRTGFRLSPKKLRLELDLAGQAACVHIADGPTMQVRFEERAQCYLAVAFSE
ncbi:MAG: 4'-phosphopantetheinyl transferase family protein, partial [Rhodothermales bacterium]